MSKLLKRLWSEEQGQDIAETAAPSAEPARIIDLMAALKASLGKGKSDGAAPTRAAAAPAESSEPSASRRSAQKSAAAGSEPKRARKRASFIWWEPAPVEPPLLP